MNSDQLEGFHAVQSGINVFLTGPAGSGKSFLIRRIVEWAVTNNIQASVTALTGCAALLLGTKAKTLHSWAGIGLGRETADALAAAIMKNPNVKRRWKKTQVLIVDEISMMTPDLFDKLDLIGKRVRGSGKPWGGIQLILCGDFFQLPPVVRGISGEIAIPGRFAFESPTWKDCGLKPVLLSKIERQTDATFQKLLNECRIGEPSADMIALLKTRQGLDWKTRIIRPTLLFSRNADVDTINEKNIAALQKPIRVFDAKTEIVPLIEDPSIEIPTGDLLDRFTQRLDNDANYCPHLELCIGAQVMLLTNQDLEAGLVNGSRGVITGFRTDNIPIVQFMHGDPISVEYHSWRSNDSPIMYRKQIPLRVAYAITIHKSQGATLDCALVDIGSSTFEYGQAYVALSRVRNLESLYIWNLDPLKIKAHPTVVKFYQELMEAPVAEPVAQIAPVLRVFGTDLIDADWRNVVQLWALTAKGQATLKAVEDRSSVVPVFPPPADILNALQFTPLRSVKVVLLGQDPYHGYGQAHGLSFSVRAGTALPPSLKNVRKEMIADIGASNEDIWPASMGDLTSWARQGVLLLNSALTVEEKNAASHSGIGWDELTSRLLMAVIDAHVDDPIVFLAWGKFAQSVIYKLRLGPKHKVLAAVHPSPLSAHAGFFGSKPFSNTNTFLTSVGANPIVWTISTDSVKDAAVGDPE